jgi:hypothetical protein
MSNGGVIATHVLAEGAYDFAGQTGRYVYGPTMEMSDSGTVVTSWQTFDGNESALITAGAVSPLNLRSFFPLDFAFHADGRFVAIGAGDEDLGDAGFRPFVVGRTFSASGAPLTADYVIYRGPINQFLGGRSVGIDGSDTATVVWEDIGAINGRQLSLSGGVLNEIAPITIGARAIQPKVAVRANGGFVVTWADRETDRVPLQQYQPDGTKLGGLLNADTAVSANTITRYSQVALNGHGDGIITWVQEAGGQSPITARLLKASNSISSVTTPTDESENGATIFGTYIEGVPLEVTFTATTSQPVVSGIRTARRISDQ